MAVHHDHLAQTIDRFAEQSRVAGLSNLGVGPRYDIRLFRLRLEGTASAPVSTGRRITTRCSDPAPQNPIAAGWGEGYCGEGMAGGVARRRGVENRYK